MSGVVGQTRVTTFFFRAGGGQDGETPEAEEEGEEEEAEAQPAELEGESRGGGSPGGGRLGPGMGDRGGCKGDSHGIQGLPSPVGPPLLYLQRPCFRIQSPCEFHPV